MSSTALTASSFVKPIPCRSMKSCWGNRSNFTIYFFILLSYLSPPRRWSYNVFHIKNSPNTKRKYNKTYSKKDVSRVDFLWSVSYAVTTEMSGTLFAPPSPQGHIRISTMSYFPFMSPMYLHTYLFNLLTLSSKKVVGVISIGAHRLL